MKKEELSIEKQKEFDDIVNEMMKEIEKLPPLDGKILDNSQNAKRREIEKRYFPKMRKLFEQ